MLVCQRVSPIKLLLGVQQATTDGDQLLAASNTGNTGICHYTACMKTSASLLKAKHSCCTCVIAVVISYGVSFIEVTIAMTISGYFRNQDHR